jgi:hypothetical protein
MHQPIGLKTFDPYPDYGRARGAAQREQRMEVGVQCDHGPLFPLGYRKDLFVGCVAQPTVARVKDVHARVA